jgi:hypothetical protein
MDRLLDESEQRNAQLLVKNKDLKRTLQVKEKVRRSLGKVVMETEQVVHAITATPDHDRRVTSHYRCATGSDSLLV